MGRPLGPALGYSFDPGPEKSVRGQRKLKPRVAGTRAALTTVLNFMTVAGGC